jgi:hypothetical protein
MAKHGKTLPARRSRAIDDSLLIRSAESLGRMIGSLQRQLDDASRKLPGANELARLAGLDGHDTTPRSSRKSERPKARKNSRKPKTATRTNASSKATGKRSRHAGGGTRAPQSPRARKTTARTSRRAPAKATSRKR